MTFEAYLNGALWFRQQNVEPSADGEVVGDGRLVNGEWCEIKFTSQNYQKSGSRWSCDYTATVDIPLYVLLVRSVVTTVYRTNPDGRVDQPYEFRYQGLGMGRRRTDVRIAGVDRGDDELMGDGSTSWRMTVRFYFVRVTQKILRDPNQGNKIIGSLGGRIMRDA